ncbi:hypothetical protein [Ilumatobacter sp.]|uniref:hypothetical protein n=1 Tax=Ilumatobacter sp. TaxID=1967498 RepID=UPI00375229D5
MAVTPIEVFVAAGADRWHEAQALRAHELVRLVPTPRHATVLLVAGTILESERAALDRVHDQLPHPREVVTWDEIAAAVDMADDVVDAVAFEIVGRADAVVADPTTSSPTRLPDEETHEWRDVGPFGQGGEGMMGGTPYGRAMAMTADDRDGLRLDRLQLRLGPFLGQLPGGLVADVALQGEVIQSIEFACAGSAPVVTGDRSVPVARRLLWLSHALHVQGLDAFAVRAARLARRSSGVGDDSRLASDFSSLRRRLRWTGLRSALRDVGDRDGVDTWARWSAHLDAISASLDGADPRLSPAGGSMPITAAELAETITGLTLTDAVSTIIGFDIDVPAMTTAAVEP